MYLAKWDKWDKQNKMKRIINHLRQKPEEERKHIARLITIFGAVLLVVFWAFTLRTNFKNSDLKTQIKDDLEPFGELTANTVDGFNTLNNNQQ